LQHGFDINNRLQAFNTLDQKKGSVLEFLTHLFINGLNKPWACMRASTSSLLRIAERGCER
jgi:hypothetical protein